MAIDAYMMSLLSNVARLSAREAVKTALAKETGGFDPVNDPQLSGNRAATAVGSGVTSLIDTVESLIEDLDARYLAEECATVNVAEYTVGMDDRYVDVQYTATGHCAIVLPTAKLMAKRTVTIVDGAGNAGEANHDIVISTEGAEKIGASDTRYINTNNGKVTLIPVPGANKWLPIS